MITSELLLHPDCHVRYLGRRSAPAHPTTARGGTTSGRSTRRPHTRSHRSRKNAIWPRCASHGLPSVHSLTRAPATIFSVFRVPTTHDVITALFHPSYPKSHIDILNLGLLAFQIFLFYSLPSTPRKLFFFLYFAFWRAAYDAGLGYVLTKQSKRKWIVRTVHKLGWLDQERRPLIRAWIRQQLVGKMGKDYSFDVRPLILWPISRLD